MRSSDRTLIERMGRILTDQETEIVSDPCQSVESASSVFWIPPLHPLNLPADLIRHARGPLVGVVEHHDRAAETCRVFADLERPVAGRESLEVVQNPCQARVLPANSPTWCSCRKAPVTGDGPARQAGRPVRGHPRSGFEITCTYDYVNDFGISNPFRYSRVSSASAFLSSTNASL